MASLPTLRSGRRPASFLPGAGANMGRNSSWRTPIDSCMFAAKAFRFCRVLAILRHPSFRIRLGDTMEKLIAKVDNQMSRFGYRCVETHGLPARQGNLECGRLWKDRCEN